MKSRSNRIRREFLCISMSFVLTAAFSIFPSNHTSVVHAGWTDDVVMTASDLQFDGSRYYRIVSMFTANLSWTWQVFLNNNVEQIITDTPLIDFSIDTSIFIEDLPGCLGFQSCDEFCNNCVRQGNIDCAVEAVAEQILAEVAVGTLCIACIAGLSWTGIGVLACVVACAAVLVVITAGTLARFRTCKAGVPGRCTDLNPGCICRAISR